MKLLNWYLFLVEDNNIKYVLAYGNILNSNKFKNNTFIKTSHITKIKYNKEIDSIIIKTNSLSVYKLPIKHIDKNYLKDTKIALKFLLNKNINNIFNLN